MDAESTDIDAENPDRTPGFLTRRNRQYLLGEWEPDYPVASARHDIKVRTRHAFADFALLQEHGDGELKHDLLHLKEDERIMSKKQKRHMIEGVLQIALDASAGEDFTDHLMGALEEHTMEIDDEDARMADELMSGGNPDLFLRKHFERLGKELSHSISGRDAARICQRVWDS